MGSSPHHQRPSFFSSYFFQINFSPSDLSFCGFVGSWVWLSVCWFLEPNQAGAREEVDFQSFIHEKEQHKRSNRSRSRPIREEEERQTKSQQQQQTEQNRKRFLCVDTLSLLLSMVNVSSNSDILVVDMVGGLLTGAVAKRLGGTGFVCNSYLGHAPSMDIVRIFNLSDEICKRKCVHQSAWRKSLIGQKMEFLILVLTISDPGISHCSCLLFRSAVWFFAVDSRSAVFCLSCYCWLFSAVTSCCCCQQLLWCRIARVGVFGGWV